MYSHNEEYKSPMKKPPIYTLIFEKEDSASVTAIYTGKPEILRIKSCSSMSSTHKITAKEVRKERKPPTSLKSIQILSTPSGNALIEQDVPMVRVARILLCRPKKCLHRRLINHLHILVIKEEPVVVTFHKADIMTMVRPASYVDDNCKQRVLIVRIIHCVGQLQLHRKHDTVG